MWARYFGCAGSVTSTIDVPLNSGWPVSGLTGFGRVRRAAVVADIGDVAVALLVNGRLVGGAVLQVVVADEAHVARFRRIADLRRAGYRHHVRLRHLRDGRQRQCGEHGAPGEHCAEHAITVAPHEFLLPNRSHPRRQTILLVPIDGAEVTWSRWQRRGEVTASQSGRDSSQAVAAPAPSSLDTRPAPPPRRG